MHHLFETANWPYLLILLLLHVMVDDMRCTIHIHSLLRIRRNQVEIFWKISEALLSERPAPRGPGTAMPACCVMWSHVANPLDNTQAMLVYIILHCIGLLLETCYSFLLLNKIHFLLLKLYFMVWWCHGAWSRVWDPHYLVRSGARGQLCHSRSITPGLCDTRHDPILSCQVVLELVQ